MGTYTRDIHRIIVAHAATRAGERGRSPLGLLRRALGGPWRRFVTTPAVDKAAVALAIALIAVLVPVALAVLR
jgi:hypothetical protein